MSYFTEILTIWNKLKGNAKTLWNSKKLLIMLKEDPEEVLKNVSNEFEENLDIF